MLRWPANIASQAHGQRLVDLSLNAIEIIDRNLYERTCDVRWWATDSAVVDGVRLTPEERARSRVLLVDAKRRVIASSDGQGVLSETIHLDMGGRSNGVSARTPARRSPSMRPRATRPIEG